MASPILRRQGGKLAQVATDDIFIVRYGRLLPVSGAYQVRKRSSSSKERVLRKVFDISVAAPVLKAKTLKHSEITLYWNAVPGATKYQIRTRQVRKDAKGKDIVVKHSDSYSSFTMSSSYHAAQYKARSHRITGLKENSSYIFTIRAIRRVGDTDIGSPESAAIRFNTGQRQRRTSGSQRRTFWASGSDSWDEEKNWARFAGYVGQGAPPGTSKKRNVYGCVDYRGVRNSLVGRHKYVWGDGGKKIYIADKIAITKAVITGIYREGNNPALTAPKLHLRCGQFNFAVNKRPAINNQFVAKDDIVEVTAGRVNTLVNGSAGVTIPPAWVREWIKSTTPWNGIVMYRSDATNYAVFDRVGDQKDARWRLTISYKWDFVYRVFIAPKAMKYTLGT